MPAIITYTIRDAKGAAAKMEVPIPADTLAEDAIGFAQGLGVLIDFMLYGYITHIQVAYQVPLPEDIQTEAFISADVEEGAIFQFQTDGNHLLRVRIPAFNEARLLPGTNQVDLTDVNVDPFVDAMTAGLIGPSDALVRVCDRREELSVAVHSALENFTDQRR